MSFIKPQSNLSGYPTKFNVVINIFILVLFVGLSLAFYRMTFNTTGDILAHVKFSESVAQGEKEYPANFLIYFILNLFNGLHTKLVVVSILLSGAVCLKYKLLVEYFTLKNIPVFWGLIVGFALLFIFSAGNVNLYKNLYYLGSFTPTVWHNSTIILLTPFALLLYFFLTEKDKTFKNNLIILVLIVLNAIIKPSFLFVLIPFLLLVSFLQPKDRKRFLLFAASCIAIIVLQYLLIYILNIGSFQKEKSGVAVNPLEFWKIYTKIKLLPLAFLIGYLFPLFFLVFNWNFSNNRDILQAWLLVFISLGIFLIFIETGPRRGHANFYWQIVPSSIILFIMTIKEYILNYSTIQKKNWLLFLLGLHFMYGVFYFYNIVFNNVIL